MRSALTNVRSSLRFFKLFSNTQALILLIHESVVCVIDNGVGRLRKAMSNHWLSVVLSPIWINKTTLGLLLFELFHSFG